MTEDAANTHDTFRTHENFNGPSRLSPSERVAIRQAECEAHALDWPLKQEPTPLYTTMDPNGASPTFPAFPDLPDVYRTYTELEEVDDSARHDQALPVLASSTPAASGIAPAGVSQRVEEERWEDAEVVAPGRNNGSVDAGSPHPAQESRPAQESGLAPHVDLDHLSTLR